jgi:hypothetical protein
VKTRSLVNNTGLAGNLQFYGTSPSNPTVTQTVTISPPDNFAATVYAPGADWISTATPDIVSAVVVKSSYAKGNVSSHYDRALDRLSNIH